MKSKNKFMDVWAAIEDLRYNPMRTKEYFGFAGAQGEAIAIKGERGIILDSQEGVVLTNATDAARYMVGEIKWEQVRPQRRFEMKVKKGVLVAWVESDRFVAPCTCRPVSRGDYISVGGEDDCPVHGFGDGEDDES